MFRLFSYVFIGVILTWSIESVVSQKIIQGKITFNGPKTIDQNGQVKVSLRDVSLMDVPSTLIASTVISNPRSFPIPYQLRYNSWNIKSGNSYSVSAEITGVDGKLLYTNDFQHRVELNSNTPVNMDIAVIQIGESVPTNNKKRTAPKECAPVKCPGSKLKQCPYGYEKLNGCEVCRCNDPCNPSGKAVLCGANQRCFVDKKADGTFGTRCGVVPSTAGAPGQTQHVHSKAVCTLPKFTGKCRGDLKRFFYNSATKECELFTYGGCNGNGNNFKTQVECESTCKA